MSSLFHRSLMLRVHKYPEQVERAKQMYDEALVMIRGLTVDPNGDVASEAEQFRAKLRECDTKLLVCYNYCVGLEMDLASDTESMAEYQKTAPGDMELIDASAEVVMEYAEVKRTKDMCRSHRSVVERARKIISVVLEQKSLRRLILFVEELQHIDSEV
ncbi:hypothetical protein IJJ37_01950 [Candidatus Saccharibacteria bacterium]|nr:hypothetical protein [Candidatus Saccharibacteria bacterium]